MVDDYKDSIRVPGDYIPPNAYYVDIKYGRMKHLLLNPYEEEV